LLYGLLASDTFRHEIPWGAIHFFFGDERWVPHTHRESNYKLANDELFRKVDVNPHKVFPMPTERISPDEASGKYASTLREDFTIRAGDVPRFDLIFLGMGDDGHTASIFPHTDVVAEEEKLVAAPYVEKLASHRITLTPPVLRAAAEVLFLVSGESKAPALREVLEGEENVREYPAQLLRKAEGRVTWLVDRPAASQLQLQYREA
jgi:6-phosphogluconolactonase